MKKKYSVKKGAWFAKVRGSYIPVSWQGWLTYIPYVGFLIASMGYVNQTSDHLYEIPIRIVPYWVSAAVVMFWLARNKS